MVVGLHPVLPYQRLIKGGITMSESKERDGVFGKYTEHYDDDGNKIWESRKREGVFGDYTEHTDENGNVIGESRKREGIFGDYTEHTDTDGRLLGESRTREGIFGDYTEHTDSDGNKIGESRERDGVFGEYTEHRGSSHFTGSEAETSSEGKGLIATLANFAGMIGAGIGAIAGLAFAIDHSYGFVGYILSLIVGSLIGAGVGSIGVYVLFIGAGLFILVSILRACGVNI
jgi:hypothetical protein